MDGHLFSVEPTEVVVPPFGDDVAVPNEDAANQRVRAHAPSTALRHFEGAPHVGGFLFRPRHGCC